MVRKETIPPFLASGRSLFVTLSTTVAPPFRDRFSHGLPMSTAPPLVDSTALEKLREAELEEARAIQSVMLPGQSLYARGVRVHHEFQPVSAVGGDFLDYFELSDGTIGLYLGDVSGKGLPAAMYAALAVGTLRGVHKTGQAPAAVLSTLNRRLLVRGVPRRYSATQYALFEPNTSKMTIASAGMPGPFHLSARGCRVLEVPGMPPGLFPDITYDSCMLSLEPGDSVVFCTDGITDAFNQEDDSFGVPRLRALFDTKLRTAPAELLAAMFSAVEAFRNGRKQHDDMAAAVFHYEGPAGGRPAAPCGNATLTRFPSSN
jgi:phosphoserine phosphatase RsbU/P